MSFRLLSLLGQKTFKPVVTVPLVVEYEKSLCDPRTEVPFNCVEIKKFLNYFCSVSELQKVHFLWRPFLKDPQDDMVLEAAVNGGCEYVVTYNQRDFKQTEKFGLEVITPGKFLKRKGKLK